MELEVGRAVVGDKHTAGDRDEERVGMRSGWEQDEGRDSGGDEVGTGMGQG